MEWISVDLMAYLKRRTVLKAGRPAAWGVGRVWIEMDVTLHKTVGAEGSRCRRATCQLQLTSKTQAAVVQNG